MESSPMHLLGYALLASGGALLVAAAVVSLRNGLPAWIRDGENALYAGPAILLVAIYVATEGWSNGLWASASMFFFFISIALPSRAALLVDARRAPGAGDVAAVGAAIAYIGAGLLFRPDTLERLLVLTMVLGAFLLVVMLAVRSRRTLFGRVPMFTGLMLLLSLAAVVGGTWSFARTRGNLAVPLAALEGPITWAEARVKSGQAESFEMSVGGDPRRFHYPTLVNHADAAWPAVRDGTRARIEFASDAGAPPQLQGLEVDGRRLLSPADVRAADRANGNWGLGLAIMFTIVCLGLVRSCGTRAEPRTT